MPSSGTKRIVVDTYAWIEYFKGSKEGLKAKKYIEGDFLLFTPSIAIAELSSIYRREQIQEWDIRKKFIMVKSQALDIDEKTADRAGIMKQELRKNHKDAGLADAIVAAHALETGAQLLTGDKHLRNLKGSIDITR